MFTIEDHGTIVLIRPLTDDVAAWLHENVQPEAMWHGNALVVEGRYVESIVLAMIDEGFAAQ